MGLPVYCMPRCLVWWSSERTVRSVTDRRAATEPSLLNGRLLGPGEVGVPDGDHANRQWQQLAAPGFTEGA